VGSSEFDRRLAGEERATKLDLAFALTIHTGRRIDAAHRMLVGGLQQ